ncbi:MAG TPA: hypothetical protein VNO32_11840 [Candidatus Acidoferrum sp.]|nr:hypothetical protein [Candidatus Acidoferrum sp.]
MNNFRHVLAVLSALALLGIGARIASSQESAAASSTVQVHMVITDEALRDDSEVPILRPENVKVQQGKTSLKADQLIPARGDNPALQLFILIDDTCDTGIGNSLNDLRDFINAQPTTTVVGVAYMSNATIQIAQNFTNDHAAAAKAVRLPRGSVSSMDSPYLSLISLLKSWPEQKVRREVLMVSDGIDRLRSDPTSRAAYSPSYGRATRAPVPTSTMSTGMSTISPDADTASTTAQRYGVIVHGIYATGVGRMGRNAWEAQLGQGGVGKIADESGGEYFSLGTQNLVSFKPYLDRLQRVLDNQYYLVFGAVPKNKAGLQRVKISTETPGFEIAAADNVWVPGANEAAGSKKN